MERISPDITTLGSTQNPLNSATTDVPITIRNSSSSLSPVHGAMISEVPPGLYEIIVGSNGEVKILCKICQYMSNKKSNFKRHFTNMHFVHSEDSSKVLECCGIRFTTKGEKFQHTKAFHKTGYKCSICFKVFDRPALLQRHLAKHTGKKPYKCSLCSYQTPNKANAKRHIEKRHSDVQDGTILFVTDDGEQIQMDEVSKKDPENRALDVNPEVVKSTADSTSFGSFSSRPIPIPVSSSLNLPLSRSSSVTSSSLSPPGELFSGPLASVFDSEMTPTDIMERREDKKRKLTHSIDAIMKQHAETHFKPNTSRLFGSPPITFPHCSNFMRTNEGNTASVSGQENCDSAKTDNHVSINELRMGSFCSPNPSHFSSLFPPNNDYAARSAHAPHPGFLQSSTFPSSIFTGQGNQGSSFVFHQCVHGCWHHADSQVASDLISTYTKEISSSISTPFTYSLPHESPDLRSSSSSVSQQTENASTLSLKSDEDNDCEIIDVVGDEEGGGDDSTRKFSVLRSLCEGMGSFSTNEPQPPTERQTQGILECKTEANLMSSSQSLVNCTSKMEDVSSTERYVPKKLRVARSHTNK